MPVCIGLAGSVLRNLSDLLITLSTLSGSHTVATSIETGVGSDVVVGVKKDHGQPNSISGLS